MPPQQKSHTKKLQKSYFISTRIQKCKKNLKMCSPELQMLIIGGERVRSSEFLLLPEKREAPGMV